MEFDEEDRRILDEQNALLADLRDSNTRRDFINNIRTHARFDEMLETYEHGWFYNEEFLNRVYRASSTTPLENLLLLTMMEQLEGLDQPDDRIPLPDLELKYLTEEEYNLWVKEFGKLIGALAFSEQNVNALIDKIVSESNRSQEELEGMREELNLLWFRFKIHFRNFRG